MFEIRLSASEVNWRLFMTRKNDPKFQNFAERVLQRDRFTCCYCGFQAKQLQEVINLDGNYLNNRLDNLVTACNFCAQCFFLEVVGKSDFGGGVLIYLPEISQNELNALCHVLFTMMTSGNSHDETNARNTYRSLRLRSQVVEQELGEGLSSPSLYGHLLIDAEINPSIKNAVNRELSDKLRLLPDITRFTSHLETWLLAALKECGYKT
ncbi:MAG: type IVB secretion system protein IcmJDotN [Proteobacteria bacterium]|nr:type IVB secretion system protein IcmJDotN [Pseudomonadota bacterium]